MKEKKKIEIRFAGAGGQGLQSAASVFGKSLILSTDKFVCQAQNYGPESRGGLSYSDLIISDEEIDFPKIRIPDILVCMSQEAFLKFKIQLLDGSVQIIILDPEMVNTRNVLKKSENLKVYKISATLISEEIVGTRILSNTVLVGALFGILRIGDQKSIEKVLADEWAKLAEANVAAFRRGLELVQRK